MRILPVDGVVGLFEVDENYTIVDVDWVQSGQKAYRIAIGILMGSGSESYSVTINPFFLSECQHYQTLTTADRKITFALVSTRCDSSLGPGWFRFQGNAGTKMPTSCPAKTMCDTHATGWLNGAHPTEVDGKVTRQVCFHWSSGCCNWSTNIQVRNCGFLLCVLPEWHSWRCLFSPLLQH